MSSANPNKIVPNIVKEHAKWVTKNLYGTIFPIAKQNTKLDKTKAVADANPIDYGILISPNLLPFLLRSYPQMSPLSIKVISLGIMYNVAKKAKKPINMMVKNHN